MVKFQCLRSGNTVSFSNENDIEGMRKHESYREIHNEKEAIKEVAVENPDAEKVLKRLGRPRKVVMEV